MMLDANTTAKMIRHTILQLKEKGVVEHKKEPGKSILAAFNELANSFDNITERARAEHEEAARIAEKSRAS